ncbi:S1C family serine protease [Polyangium sorediatum]|uniref:Trypsin-like peptidase domain-containing protein n=1 Tax=Polyangium sorediatum TaxID=889274 RepID=A0ABT6P5I7_9BACT|nr:trypsin-like peptidase domain-containing protein [Polyangium sorediatum]MDI1435899.1 trypsin-like peptidase domain-containing protein [Polyangium sorediatum]
MRITLDKRSLFAFRPAMVRRLAAAMTLTLCFSPALAWAAGSELAELAERTKPSVVLLTVEDATGHTVGTGTGFFVSSDGRIVTNHHVVDGAAKVTATLADGSKLDVLGRLGDDEARDIAILKADGAGLPALTLGDSSGIATGDEVVVIGSPLGLSGTLTVGIVSAKRERGVGKEIDRASELESWGIQITAAISPGSSGSPIMTRRGEVVAVAVGTLNRAQSLNFGIPIEVVKGMLEKLGPAAPVLPFESNPEQDVLRNLLISAAVIGGLVVVVAVWSFVSTRGSRPKARRGN